ncbi:MAG: SMI1/KNR4 family protein, partial [Sphingobacteriaceae bacterium]
MFEPKSTEEIFGIIVKTKNPVKNTQKIPIQDSDYQLYISNYKDFEITPDIQLFGYEKSILENRQIEKDYPDIAKQVWMFAISGQGDEWFFAKDSELVLYYDHNQGDYQNIQNFLNF